jgi:BlaI family penicillinase repressor
VRFLRELSERFFAGSAAQLALRALEIDAASDAELNVIRRLIAKKEASRLEKSDAAQGEER